MFPRQAFLTEKQMAGGDRPDHMLLFVGSTVVT
jgi:hypothetical protein